MSDLSFSNQRKNLRLKGYDYSTPAHYFITIVIQGRLELLGSIIDDKMVLSEGGAVIDNYIRNIPLYHQGCEVPYHVVMPNHVHFILTVNGGHYVAEILRRMKSATTHAYINGVRQKGWKSFNNHLWQRNYYEHIIRNQRSYNYIATYICENPLRWANDNLNNYCHYNPDDINNEIKMLE